MMGHMTTSRSSAAGKTGWILVAVSLVGIAFWIVVKAFIDDAAFNNWVGWANILALLVGAIGTALVILDRMERRAQQPAPAEPSSVQNITAHWGGVAQGVQGLGSRIVNHAGTGPGLPPVTVSREVGGHDEPGATNHGGWWRRLWRGEC
jgi:uncharacterized membrane protein YfcA